MGFMAAIIGSIGGICAVIGVLIAAEIIPGDIALADFGWDFWFMLAGVLLLGSIALLLGKGPKGD